MPLIIIQLAITFIVLISAGYFIWLVIFSIPYWPSNKKFITDLKKIINLEKPHNIAELGAGDGRIAFELCEMGYQVDAYEINPIFSIFIRLRKIFRNEKNITIYNKNFLTSKIDYSRYQVAVLYLNPKLMGLLEQRLLKQMPNNSIIISNTFKFPNKSPEKVCDKMLVYRVKRDKNDIFSL